MSRKCKVCFLYTDFCILSKHKYVSGIFANGIRQISDSVICLVWHWLLCYFVELHRNGTFPLPQEKEKGRKYWQSITNLLPGHGDQRGGNARDHKVRED